MSFLQCRSEDSQAVWSFNQQTCSTTFIYAPFPALLLHCLFDIIARFSIDNMLMCKRVGQTGQYGH